MPSFSRQLVLFCDLSSISLSLPNLSEDLSKQPTFEGKFLVPLRKYKNATIATALNGTKYGNAFTFD